MTFVLIVLFFMNCFFKAHFHSLKQVCSSGKLLQLFQSLLFFSFFFFKSFNFSKNAFKDPSKTVLKKHSSKTSLKSYVAFNSAINQDLSFQDTACNWSIKCYYCKSEHVSKGRMYLQSGSCDSICKCYS